MANRLSETGKWSVLLVEAGGDETIFTDIPGSVYFSQQSKINWGYQTVPQTDSCLALKDQK